MVERDGNETYKASGGETTSLVQRERSKTRRAGLETSCIERSIYKGNTTGLTWRQEVETESPGGERLAIYTRENNKR